MFFHCYYVVVTDIMATWFTLHPIDYICK